MSRLFPSILMSLALAAAAAGLAFAAATPQHAVAVDEPCSTGFLEANGIPLPPLGCTCSFNVAREFPIQFDCPEDT